MEMAGTMVDINNYRLDLRSSLPNRVRKKITRDLVHKICPKLMFRKLLEGQRLKFSSPTYTLSFDLDFYKDYERVPQILNQLEKYKTKAVFAVIGRFVEEFPDIHSQMVSTGHELVNHTFTHPDNPHWAPSRYFNQLSSAEQLMK